MNSEKEHEKLDSEENLASAHSRALPVSWERMKEIFFFCHWENCQESVQKVNGIETKILYNPFDYLKIFQEYLDGTQEMTSQMVTWVAEAVPELDGLQA